MASYPTPRTLLDAADPVLSSGLKTNAKPCCVLGKGLSKTFTSPRFQLISMEKNEAWVALPGETCEEKLQSLGAVEGSMLDIRMLDEIEPEIRC